MLKLYLQFLVDFIHQRIHLSYFKLVNTKSANNNERDDNNKSSDNVDTTVANSDHSRSEDKHLMAAFEGCKPHGHHFKLMKQQ